MPKKPMPTDMDTNDLEAGVEEAAEKVIDEVAPPELKGQARSVLRAVLQTTERQPLTALLIAVAIGYLAAVLLK